MFYNRPAKAGRKNKKLHHPVGCVLHRGFSPVSKCADNNVASAINYSQLKIKG